MRRTTLFIVLGPLVLPICYALAWIVLPIAGYHVWYSSGDLAEKLVREGKPAKECYRLLSLDLAFGPTVAEKRDTCVYEYAKLAVNPAACEHLMPSYYGLWCVGSVRSLVQTEFCVQKAVLPELSCIQDGKVFTYPVHGIDRCEGYDNRLVRDWCYRERSFSLPVNDCDKTSTPLQRDACLIGIAERQMDLKMCNEVQQPTLRSACEVLVKAFRDHPELRNNR